ncbi:hypothetical protein SAMN04487913_105225 [Arthrobacter sp. ok362]|jgi:hypothetical protein|nr:hypothetical protein SAMN04487913_105225 [Arthrobacter sp. ok362]
MPLQVIGAAAITGLQLGLNAPAVSVVPLTRAPPSLATAAHVVTYIAASAYDAGTLLANSVV